MFNRMTDEELAALVEPAALSNMDINKARRMICYLVYALLKTRQWLNQADLDIDKLKQV